LILNYKELKNFMEKLEDGCTSQELQLLFLGNNVRS